MKINFGVDKPIFWQIAEEISEAIIIGAYEEESQIPSITEFSLLLKINPATVLKGVTILVDEGILYKKRGVGMFVEKGAKEKMILKRRDEFFEKYIYEMMEEAKRLNIDKEDIIRMIKGERN